MCYDPTLYNGAAAYYVFGRPAYSRELVPTLCSELGLDGSGRLLDIGCGPGVLSLELANLFEEIIGIDPDAEMLEEGARRAHQCGAKRFRWIQARAEDIAELNLGMFRLAAFGQSFHWTDRERVAEMVYDSLEPEGAIAAIGHTPEGRPVPAGPGYPPIPHKAIHALIARYLGPRRRAGQGFASLPTDKHELALASTRFGVPKSLFCAGRNDIVQTIDGVLANYLSTSFAAPHLFGDRFDSFVADFRVELTSRSDTGSFWDWPGDTEILLARKDSSR